MNEYYKVDAKGWVFFFFGGGGGGGGRRGAGLSFKQISYESRVSIKMLIKGKGMV